MAAVKTGGRGIQRPPGTVPELLSWRRGEADGEFLVTDQERLTFAEADASPGIGRGAVGLGRGQGNTARVLFPNCAEWLITWLAAARVGALTVPLSTFAPGAELARLLRHTDTQFVDGGRSAGKRSGRPAPGSAAGHRRGRHGNGVAPVPYLRRVHVWPERSQWASPWPEVSGSVVALADSAEREVPADDLVLVSTSGTTALPKSVVHTHGSLVRHAFVLAAIAGSVRTTESTRRCRFSGWVASPWWCYKRCPPARRSWPRMCLRPVKTLALLNENGPRSFRAGRRPAKRWPTIPTSPSATCPASVVEPCCRRCPTIVDQRTRPHPEHAGHDRNGRPAHHGRSSRYAAATRTTRLLRHSPPWRGITASWTPTGWRYPSARTAKSRCGVRS